MPHTLDLDRIGEVIQTIMDCPDYDRKFSAWEQDFMETVSDAFKLYGKLSEGRLEKLEEIYQKV